MQSGYIHLTEYQSGQLLNTHEKKHDCLTAVLQKWRFSASYDSEVVNQNLVLRLKFSGENRHLRKAAKRCVQHIFRTYAESFSPIFSERNLLKLLPKNLVR